MQPMRKLHRSASCLFLLCCCLDIQPVLAMPEYLLRFSQDPFSRPEYRNQCSTCHINPQGSGPRKPFGEAFEKNHHRVTPEFRQAWPSHFVPSLPSDPLSSGQGEIKATFLANEQETILEINGEYFRLRHKEARLEKVAPAQAASLPALPSEPKLPLRNQPTFDHYLVNLPTTLSYERGRLSLRFTHRFTQPAFESGLSDLFGLDSFSFSSIGGAYGITNRLAATVYRSPFDKTIELGGVFQVLRQQGSEPFSAAVRVSVEGRNNFHDHYTTNLVFPVSRAISSIAELFVVPQVSWNANPFAPFASPFAPEGERRQHMASVGLGASLRFRPRSAFVAEWMPRVGGFRERNSRNAVSFGILRSTNAHVFELVLTNSFGTTTSRAVSGGAKDFTLGFNIYRRLQ